MNVAPSKQSANRDSYTSVPIMLSPWPKAGGPSSLDLPPPTFAVFLVFFIVVVIVLEKWT